MRSALAGTSLFMNEAHETPRPLDEQVFDAISCPFCTSSDLGFYEYVYAKSFTVICRACGAQGPRRASTSAALALWNGRNRS